MVTENQTDPFDDADDSGVYQALRVDPSAPEPSTRILARAHFRQRILAVCAPIVGVFAGILVFKCLPETGLLAVEIGPVSVKGVLSGVVVVLFFSISYWLIREEFGHKR